MSDDSNVLFPSWPARPGQAAGSGGDGPHMPSMGPRVAALEADMKDVKSSLGRIETTLAVMAEGMKALATKSEVVSNTGAVNALSEKVTGLTTRLATAESAVSGKMIGPWQLPAILGACIAIGVTGVAAYNWMAAHVGVMH